MPDYSIRVIERLFAILKTLVEREKPLHQISAETGINKSTAFRVLSSLQNEAWVQQNPETGFYRLGFGLFQMGMAVANNLDLYKISLPHIEKLSRVVKATVHLVTHDNGQALYLYKLDNPDSFINQPSRTGHRVYMHCTAVGKAMLANMDRSEVEQIIRKHGLPRQTPNTITTKEALYEELDAIRRRGYSIDNQEIQEGLRCIAAPIFGLGNRLMGAISISGLIGDLSEKLLPKLKQEVMQTAKNISLELGCQDLDPRVLTAEDSESTKQSLERG